MISLDLSGYAYSLHDSIIIYKPLSLGYNESADTINIIAVLELAIHKSGAL